MLLLAHLIDDPLRHGHGPADAGALPASSAKSSDSSRFSTFFLPKPLSTLQLARLGLLAKVGLVLDAGFLPQVSRALGPEAGHVEQLEQTLGNLVEKLLVLVDLAFLLVLGDALGHALADAVDLLDLAVVHVGQVGGEPIHGPGGPVVGVGAEAVAAGELDQSGGLLEDADEIGVDRSHGAQG